MKKAANSKKNLKKKDKKSDSGELRKPAKLKPLKEKEKKNWKQSFNEDDEDFEMLPEDDNLKLDDFSSDIEEEEDGFYEDNF